MDVQNILEQIDGEIGRLQQARSALAGLNGNAIPMRRGPGRPKNTAVAAYASAPKKRSVMSAEARKRIGDAVRARHARNKALREAPNAVHAAAPPAPQTKAAKKGAKKGAKKSATKTATMTSKE